VTLGPRAAAAISEALLGVVLQDLGLRRDGSRGAAFEIVSGGPELGQVVRERGWDAASEWLQTRREAPSLRQALTALAAR
jgi:Tfp pilus assembly pilus retraction ATPase PilT